MIDKLQSLRDALEKAEHRRNDSMLTSGPKNSNFINNLGMAVNQHGIAAVIERELNYLHKRIDQLEKIFSSMGGMVLVPKENAEAVAEKYSFEDFIGQVQSGQMPNKMPLKEKESKENTSNELHPATNSSFVLKI